MRVATTVMTSGDHPGRRPVPVRGDPDRLRGYAQHVRHTVGFDWLGALGALVALSLVIALAVISSRK